MLIRQLFASFGAYAVISCFALVGCANTEAPDNLPPGYSAVSVAMPGFNPRREGTIEWLAPVFVSGVFPSDTKGQAAQATADSVKGALSRRGFVFDAAGQSDYLLFGAVLGGLGADMSQQQRDLLGLVQLYPSLGSPGAPDRNMLVLALTSREKLGDGMPLWKAAIEVYAAGESNLSDEVKLKRLESAVVKLVATLPRMESPR